MCGAKIAGPEKPLDFKELYNFRDAKHPALLEKTKGG
jgi:hypothetical protein